MAEEHRQSLMRRMRLFMWTCAGLFVVGYFPAVSGRPQWGMSLVPLAIIPWCLRGRVVRVTMLGGAAMGLLAGVSIILGLQSFLMNNPMAVLGAQAPQPMGAASRPAALPTSDWPPAASQPVEATTQPRISAAAYLRIIRPRLRAAAWRIVPGVTLMCTSVSALFGVIGRRRRRMIERQWQ